MGSITSPTFDVGDSRLKDSGYSRKEGAVVIADDVFLGAGTIVLAGVSVARRTLVGAGSLMTKSVETSSIVAGVPAKVIKTMPSDTIHRSNELNHAVRF